MTKTTQLDLFKKIVLILIVFLLSFALLEKYKNDRIEYAVTRSNMIDKCRQVFKTYCLTVSFPYRLIDGLIRMGVAFRTPSL